MLDHERVSPIETPGTTGTNVLRIVRVRSYPLKRSLRKENRDHPGIVTLSFAGKGRKRVFASLSGPASYGRYPHHHLAVGGSAEPCVAGPQLAEDVEDGVAAVVVEDSP